MTEMAKSGKGNDPGEDSERGAPQNNNNPALPRGKGDDPGEDSASQKDARVEAECGSLSGATIRERILQGAQDTAWYHAPR